MTAADRILMFVTPVFDKGAPCRRLEEGRKVTLSHPILVYDYAESLQGQRTVVQNLMTSQPPSAAAHVHHDPGANNLG
jgi:hypothetical protein